MKNLICWKLENKNVVLSTCGIGKVNAAINTQSMIDKFGVDAIIHTGDDFISSAEKKAE